MKRRMIAMTAALAACFALTACGGGSESSSEGSGSGQASGGGYTFTSGSTEIAMNADAAAVVEELGEADDYFESESCAFEGLDKVYTYPGFQLNTYPVDDKDYVLSVVFMDDTVSTDEGISIGSTKNEVTEAYGDPTSESATELVYEKGDSELKVGLDGDSVSTLEIAAVTE